MMGMTRVVCRRQGVGAAVKTGLGEATNRFVRVVDCDGSVDPRDLTALLEPLMCSDANIVFCSRSYEPAAVGRQQMALYRLAAPVVGRAASFKLDDLGSSVAIRRDRLSDEDINKLSSGSGWSASLFLRASSLGLRIAQVPIPLGARIGASKLRGTTRGKWKTAVDIIRVVRQYKQKSDAPPK